jgi:hypothetical protein
MTHHHWYSFAAGDWLCRECDTVTDYCTQLNGYAEEEN